MVELTPQRLEYGGLGRRFCALSIDALLFCTLFFPVTKMVKGVWLMGPSDHRWASGIFISDPVCSRERARFGDRYGGTRVLRERAACTSTR